MNVQGGGKEKFEGWQKRKETMAPHSCAKTKMKKTGNKNSQNSVDDKREKKMKIENERCMFLRCLFTAPHANNLCVKDRCVCVCVCVCVECLCK
mmetsp:Transcript_14778/g.29830  ORF Transcript_14778/g.29830 Transcript_14778/m.29830 type:complete len:94 (-) Transcript_14778:473-754(-)